MNEQNAIWKLSGMVQLNLDAVRILEQALDEMDLPSVREQLVRIRDEHSRHVLDLSAEINILGGSPPEYLRENLGTTTEGLLAIPERVENEELLKILEANEQVSAMRYRAARSWELSPAAAEMIRRQHGEEEVHLQIIRDELSKRVWVT